MKKKILFVGITMNCAGSEKSFLSFINCLDMNKYEPTLLLAKKSGLFMQLIPEGVRVIEMKKYGEHFLQSGENAASNIFNTFIKKNPLTGFTVLPYFLRLLVDKKHRAAVATRLWIRLMHKMPSIEEKYDIAVAYWGDRTMFYMLDKVKADKYVTWLHFDYAHPERDDSIYLPYFKKCDAIVNVSTAVDDALTGKLPELKDKCIVIENINSAKLINEMADEDVDFPDKDYNGTRILSIGRISEQKGFDLAIRALAKLSNDGIDAKWYILGAGDDEYASFIKRTAEECGMTERIVYLGTTPNPYPYIKKCDIYAQPSRYEGKPISVEEAKILAKPIVVANYLSASEQLDNGRFGLIAHIEAESIYEKLKIMICDRELREGFTRTLREESLSNEGEIDKFYEIIK